MFGNQNTTISEQYHGKNSICAVRRARLTDYLGVGVIASVFPLDAVRAALKETGRESRRIRLIPAEVMVYYVICLGLFRTVSTGEVLRCLVDGLRRAGVSFPGIPVAKRASISEARIRLGVAPLTALRRRVVGCIAERGSAGSWYRGRRLVALDGSSFSLPDERPLAESEAAQAVRLLPRLRPEMLLLADRGYSGFRLWAEAVETGAALLWRVKANRKLAVREVLADGSYHSCIGDRGGSRTRLPVRVVEYRLKGRRRPTG